MTTRRRFSLRSQSRCGNTKAWAKWGSGRNNRPGREEGHGNGDGDRDTQREMEANDQLVLYYEVTLTLGAV